MIDINLSNFIKYENQIVHINNFWSCMRVIVSIEFKKKLYFKSFHRYEIIKKCKKV